MKTIKTVKILIAFCSIVFIMLFSSTGSQAAQQYQGLCSYVKIEILQELTLERVGFLATLEVTNNEGDASITDFSAALTFQKKLTSGEYIDASDLFFVQPPKIRGVSSIDGAGVISPGQTATVEWFIIPKLNAGGTTPQGLQYQVGAALAGSIYGMEISQDVFRVLPDTITVKPDPELDITYFQPRDVDGDNPFTLDIVESPIPFTLGVLVRNVGYGPARKVKIASEQPRIVEDLQGLLVVPQLIGARVDDAPSDSASLTVDLGDIGPGKCRKGAWDMITTLSGEFTEFKASYTHAPELGGRDTSLIKSINAYFMVHEVLNDQPGRDKLLDFLAETQGGEELIPDTLYESDCNILPVNRLDNVTLLTFSGLVAQIKVTADIENWVFIRINDPGQNKYKIKSIERSDGKMLDSHNYWTHIRYRDADNVRLNYLNIFDFVSLGTYEYTVTYESSGTDTTPPETNIKFSGKFTEKDGIYYILPETRIFFIATDDSPVGTYYRTGSSGDFAPAYPFYINEGGEHTITYYSQDAEGNREEDKTATVFVSAGDPAVQNVTADTDKFFIAGDSLSVRPTALSLKFSGSGTAPWSTAELEVFRGAYGYPTVQGVPSSPTRNTGATITVGGENVDFYRYRKGTGALSQEFPVSTPVVLTGLNGEIQLSVYGRSRYGVYHSDDEATVVSWTVYPGAPLVTITGAPETTTRLSGATLNISGADYYCYNVDETYYRPDTSPGAPIVLSRLTDGDHSVEVIRRSSEGQSCPATGEGTKVAWSVNRQYGFSFPENTLVRHQLLENFTGAEAGYVWDGRDDNGAPVSPGWYTVMMTLKDTLGRSARAIRLVYAGDMISGGMVLADAGNAGQKEAHAFGKWIVWQDERNGNWDIFARDINVGSAVPVAITDNPLSQERPRTDGKYVVWEDRQADGTWDIHARELGSDTPEISVTSTRDLNERKPVIYWPWVIYQEKSVSDTSSPWQLRAYNFITGSSEFVDKTDQDQLDPAIHKQTVVWQDFRDAGYGEIYLKDLSTGEVRRITDDPGGQYYPCVFDHWIVWADNRNTQLDLYGYNLKRNVEIRLTDTPEDETRPYINGTWVVCEEDSAGESNINIKLVSLENLAHVQLTNAGSLKEKPSLASNRLIWVEVNDGRGQVMEGTIPSLQPVFNNRNMVAVTGGMATNLGDAFTVLKLWNEQAGVTGITRYPSLTPNPDADTVSWVNNEPSGNNFNLEPGTFLWVRFNAMDILDLGQNNCNAFSFVAGINVFSFSCFPEQYSAYKLIHDLGIENINAARILNSSTGRWQIVTVIEDKIIGEDFKIPSVGVLMLDMKTAVDTWKPGR